MTHALAREHPVDDVVVDIERALQSMARRAMRIRLHERLTAEAGVSLGRAGAALLRQLVEDGPELRVSELAERLGVEAPGVTRKVARLVEEGYVTRLPDPDDRRACRIHLTRKGRRAIGKLDTIRRQHLAEILTTWPTDDRAELSRLLTRFLEDSIRHHEGKR